MMFEKMKVGICKLLVEIGTKHKKNISLKDIHGKMMRWGERNFSFLYPTLNLKKCNPPPPTLVVEPPSHFRC